MPSLTKSTCTMILIKYLFQIHANKRPTIITIRMFVLCTCVHRSMSYPFQTVHGTYFADKHAIGIDSTINHGTEDWVSITVGRMLQRNIKDEYIAVVNMQQEGNFICCYTAWATDYNILDAFIRAKQRGVVVFLLIQKEERLRTVTFKWPSDSKVRRKYEEIGFMTIQTAWDRIGRHVETPHGVPTHIVETHRANTLDGKISMVRCVGICNGAKDSPMRPNMHHKVTVFGQYEGIRKQRRLHGGECCYEYDSNAPVSTHLWMGSFNLTMNSTRSFDSVCLLESKKMADSCFKEFCLLYALSEPLDWTAREMSPTLSFRL